MATAEMLVKSQRTICCSAHQMCRPLASGDMIVWTLERHGRTPVDIVATQMVAAIDALGLGYWKVTQAGLEDGSRCYLDLELRVPCCACVLAQFNGPSFSVY